MATRVGSMELGSEARVESTTPGTIYAVEYTRDVALHFHLDSTMSPVVTGEAYIARLFVENETAPPVKEGETLIGQAMISSEALLALPGAADFLPALQTAILTAATMPLSVPPP